MFSVGEDTGGAGAGHQEGAVPQRREAWRHGGRMREQALGKVANRVFQSTLATLNDWLNPFHDFTRIDKTLSRLVTTVWPAFTQHSAKQQTRVAAHRPVSF